MAFGKIVYPYGDPAAFTYNFVKNYDYGNIQGHIETDDNARAFDGTLNSYSGARKKSFELDFNHCLQAQLDAFQLAYAVGGPIGLYLDGTTLDAVVRIMSPVIGESQAAFDSGAVTWNFTVTMEEV